MYMLYEAYNVVTYNHYIRKAYVVTYVVTYVVKHVVTYDDYISILVT